MMGTLGLPHDASTAVANNCKTSADKIWTIPDKVTRWFQQKSTNF